MRSPVTRAAPLLPAGSPRIAGIVNITEDSFSDGGRHLDPAAALAHARRLRADGTDVIELGTRVRVGFVDTGDLATRVVAARAVRRSGFVPVPVIAA